VTQGTGPSQTKGEVVMGDVALLKLLKADDNSFLLTTLLGEQKLVAGRIKSIDFIQDHSIVFES